MLMKNTYLIIMLFFCIVAVTGCSLDGLESPLPEPPSTVQEIDDEISVRQERIIASHEKLRKMDLGGYADVSPLEYTMTENDIVRNKKAIGSLKKQKKALTAESVGCFLPDALVQMGDGSFKPFVNVMPGDKVMSYDIGYDKQVSRSVVKLYSVESNHLYKINDEFETTGGERLLTQDGWKEINSLKKGDIIHVNGEMIEIFAIEFNRTNHRLHNMQVDNTHNFYVSTANGTRYLVHNCDGGGGGSGGGGK